MVDGGEEGGGVGEGGVMMVGVGRGMVWGGLRVG